MRFVIKKNSFLSPFEENSLLSSYGTIKEFWGEKCIEGEFVNEYDSISSAAVRKYCVTHDA